MSRPVHFKHLPSISQDEDVQFVSAFFYCLVELFMVLQLQEQHCDNMSEKSA